MLIKLLVTFSILGLTELVPHVYSLDCISCSSDGLAACATLNGQLPRVTCAAGIESCYTYIQGETTVRGCELPETIPPEEYSSCSEDNCNANVYPENRIKCHKCTGANCLQSSTIPEAAPCQYYKEDDQCFTYYFNSVATRGCLSENDNMEPICENELLCSKCGGDSCNGNTITDEYCVVCDSTLDINCVSNINETMEERCPTSAAPMGCFRFDDGGEIIKRGCLSSIFPEEVTECRLEAQFCKTCIGDNCNAKEDFETCRSCSSATDVNCIRSPGSVAAVTCQNYLDSCFVHVENNIVTRGCVSEQTTIVQNQCAQTSSDICESCTGTNNCNDKIIDGEFCMACDSTVDPNCRTSLNFTSRVQCNLAVRPLGCYLFDDGGDIIKRGCINNDLVPGEVTLCRQQGEFCKTCYGNDCNTKLTFQRCRSCTSENDVSCIRSAGSAAELTCRDYMDTCYVHVQNNTITRGCLAQPATPTAVQTECSQTNSDLCETCTGNNCNGFLIDGEFCIDCDSQVDPNCRTSLNYTMRVQCNLAVRPLGCYLFDDGGDTIKRGCVNNDLHPGEVAMCRQEGQFCKTCYGDDCNTKLTFQRCRSCTSADDVSCIRSGGSATELTCRDYMDTCYVHVQDNTVTRGCLAQPNTPTAIQTTCSQTNSDLCETCPGNNCNSLLVDGEFCIACDSQVDPNCRTSLNYTMRTQCNLAVRPLGCYLFDDGGDIVKRGCINNDLVPGEVSMCRQQGQFCKTCYGNDCNTKLTFQQCRSCTSENDVNCIRSGGSAAELTCRDYMDTCYVHVQDNTVTRGCLAQPNTPTAIQTACSQTNSDLCETCPGNNCNSLLVDGEFCIACDSQVDPNCRTSLNYTMRAQCNLAVRPLGCYLFDDGGDIVKRGCINNDLVPGEVSMCRQQGQFCKTCYGNDCNTKLTFQQCRSCTSENDVNCIRSGGSAAELTCRDYMDECYVHVENDIVRRGCLAQPATPTAVQTECRRTNSDLCERCPGNNCNGFLIDGEFCLTCDSEIDSNCRDTLNYTMRTQCNLGVRPLGCYRYDDSGDIIKRGCLSHLITEEIAFCRQQGQFCKTCLGDDCNSKIDFQECKVCNSSLNVDCIRSPQYIDSSVCRNYLDECFVHVEDNIILRGCVQQNPGFESDCRNPDVCNACDERGNCNDQIVDGEFCITCDSEVDPNCIANVNVSMRTQCSLAVRRMGCYLFDDGGDIIKRGCLSDVVSYEVDMCRQEGQFCKTCLGNDCNTKVSFQECKSCNSSQNVDCIRSTQNIDSITCRNYLDSCYTHVENNQILRGCLEQSPSFESDCRNPDVCDACDDRGNCNDAIVDGEFCITCDSELDPNCINNLNFTMRTQCNLSVGGLGCYLFDDGGEIVKRGCVSDLIPEEVTMCRQEGQFCKTCIGNDCNTKETFQRCRSCTSANDVNCIRSGGSATELTCRNYMDTCYVHVQNDTVVRGCLSQPNTPSAIQTECTRTNSDLCETCPGNNCNGFLIDGEFCLTCDTELDSNCRDTLNYTMRTQCNLGVRPLGCYRYDDGGDIIKRGCLSHLIPEEVTMCRQQGQFCKTCIGDDCNSKIGFQECRVCNSSQNQDCIRSTNNVTSSVCRNYLDECFVHVENNIILRGCLQQNPSFESDCRNPNICTTCDEQGNCNDQIVDVEFCVTCDSQLDPNCRDSLDDVSMRTQCSLSVTKMGCYLFNDGGDIVIRGCLSDLIPEEVSMCRQEGQFCKTCQGDDCNRQVEFQQCFSCDSATNPDCLSSPNALLATQCRNYYDTCITYFENDRLIRGCSSQRNDLQLSCSNNASLCRICDSGNNCNNDLVEEEYCVTCDSGDNPNCQTLPDINMAQRCGAGAKFNKNGCYRFDDSGDIVKRGCLEDLWPEEIEWCGREGSECKTCIGDNCNLKPEFQSCHVCNSDVDINCVTLKDTVPTTICRDYLDQCRTVTLVGGRTERGCANQLTVIGEVIFEECLTRDCNSNVFPPNRRSCHQCSGPECNSDLSSNTAFFEICRNFVDDEQCFSYVDGTGEMHRGCESDITIDRNECTSAGQRCVFCDTAGCNNQPSTTQSILSCIQCNNADDECAWGYSSTRAASCSSAVIFPLTESCFTYSYANGTVSRGCTLDNQSLCNGNVQCRTCNQNACNTQNVITQSCKVCRSDVNGQERCGEETFNGLEQECGSFLEYENRGCYSKTEDGTVIRGCAVTLTSEEITECINDEFNQCIYCIGDNCNFALPSHATALKSMSFLIGAIFIVIKMIW